MAYLVTGFDIARLGSMKVAVNDGVYSGTATVASDRYCHRDLSGVSVLGGDYTAFPAAVKTAIDAAIAPNTSADGGGGGVVIALATGVYSLGLFTGSTTLDFRAATLGDASGNRLARALGFTSAHANATAGAAGNIYDFYLSGVDEYHSNVTPHYYLALARDGLTHTDGWPPYEVEGQTKGIITTLGNGYSRKPGTKIEFAEVRLGYQTKAATFTQHATTAAPWTYEDLVAHSGRAEPIAVSTTGLEFVYRDRVGDFGRDQRESAFGSFDGNWHIDVAMRFLDYL